MSAVTGLYYFDGGVLQSAYPLQAEYNEIRIYKGSELSGLGLVLQGADRYTAIGYNYYATMKNKSTGDVVFVNKAVSFTTRDALDPNYPGTDPVLVLMWDDGDLASGGTFYLQYKAVAAGTVTGNEFFSPITVHILDVTSGV